MEIKKKYTIIIACILLNTIAFTQKQYNQWYFGTRAGLNFNNGTPVPVTTSTMVANEGCASIANSAGQLLFYTNGTNVYNRFNTAMPNANGNPQSYPGTWNRVLSGDQSSGMSALITPVIGDTNRFYVFTLDGFTCDNSIGPKGKWDGLYYTVIDMRLDGGKGDIDTAFIHPQGYNPGNKIPLVDSTSEAITAIPHSNGIDYWIITKKHFFSTSIYYAYLVTCNGVNPSPVISASGTNLASGHCIYMTASRDHKTLLSLNNGDNFFEIFHFNNTDGHIASEQLVNSAGNNLIGIALSPDDSTIYISSFSNQSLLKYKRYSPIVKTSEVSVYIGIEPGQLKTGPDDKIYISSVNSFLSVINDPNNFNNPNIAVGSISLGGKTARFGLPNMFYSSYNTGLRDTSICKGDSISLAAINYNGATYHWQPSMNLNTSTHSSVKAFPTSDTKYFVTIYSQCGQELKRDSLTIFVKSLPTINAGRDTVFCENKSITLMVETNGTSYTWSSIEGIHLNDITSDTGIFIATSFLNGCENKDTVHVSFSSTENCESAIYIPNSFTPNGDGINDFFYPVSQNIDKMQMSIYNRWGELIVQTTSNLGWDGKIENEQAQQSIYNYIINTTDRQNIRHQYRGQLSLLR